MRPGRARDPEEGGRGPQAYPRYVEDRDPEHALESQVTPRPQQKLHEYFRLDSMERPAPFRKLGLP